MLLKSTKLSCSWTQYLRRRFGSVLRSWWHENRRKLSFWTKVMIFGSYSGPTQSSLRLSCNASTVFFLFFLELDCWTRNCWIKSYPLNLDLNFSLVKVLFFFLLSSRDLSILHSTKLSHKLMNYITCMCLLVISYWKYYSFCCCRLYKEDKLVCCLRYSACGGLATCNSKFINNMKS